MKRTFLRVVSMCLAVIMLVGTANLSVFASQADTGNNTQPLQSNVWASVARNGSGSEKTEGQIIAELYATELTETEKAFLASTALIGATYTIVMPTNDDDLIAIDEDEKTLTAADFTANGLTWEPVTVTVKDGSGAVIYGPEAYTDGMTFSVGEATNYTVNVDYRLAIDIEDVQERKLLNAAYNLAGAIQNLNEIAAMSTDFELVAEYIGSLYEFAGDGRTVEGETLKLDDGPATDAIVALYNETEANGGKFIISNRIEDYKAAPNKVEYLLKNGAEMVETFDTMRESFAALCADDSTLKGLNPKIADAIQKLNDAIETIREEIATAESEIQKAKDEVVTPLQTAISDANTQISTLNGMIEAYEEAGLTAKAEEKKAERKIIEDERDELQKQLDEVNAQVAEGEEAIQTGNEKIKQLNDLITEANGYISTFNTALSFLDGMYEDMNAINDKNGYWVAYTDPAVNKDADLTEVNELVLEIVDDPTKASSHDSLELIAEGYVLNTTLQGTVNQAIVTVDVRAEVYLDDGTKTIVGTDKTDGSFTFDIDSTADQIKNQIESLNFADIAAGTEGWTAAYGVCDNNYSVEYLESSIPETLEGDVTCVVVFKPVTLTINCEYDGVPETAEYRQQIQFPEDTGDVSYIYTVTDVLGSREFRGSEYCQIRANNTTITRRETMAMGEEISIPSFIVGSEIPGATLTTMDATVLNAAGIVGGTISFGTPTGGVTFEPTSSQVGEYKYLVSAPVQEATLQVTLPNQTTKYYSAKWIPVAVEGYGDAGKFNGASSVEITSATSVVGVSVTYRMTISDSEWITLDEIKTYASLAQTLMLEARAQLTQITNVRAKLKEYEQELKMIKYASDYIEKYKAVDAQGAAEFEKQYNFIMQNCFKNNELIVLTTLNSYPTSDEPMLAYYYSNGNSVVLRKQLEDLSNGLVNLIENDGGFWDWFATDETFGAAVPVILGALDKLKSFDVPAVNALLDTAASEDDLVSLVKILLSVNAAEITSKTTSKEAVKDIENLCYETVISVSETGYVKLKVKVDDKAKEIDNYYHIDDPIDDVLRQEIVALIDAVKAEAMAALVDQYGEGAKEHYATSEYASLLPTNGETVGVWLQRVCAQAAGSEDTWEFVLKYSPKIYEDVTVNGDPNDLVPPFTYQGNATSIKVPAPGDENYEYSYTIAGVTVTDRVTFSASGYGEINLAKYNIDFNKLISDGNITYVEINKGEENFQKFVAQFNAACKAGNLDAELIPTKDGSGLVLSVGTNFASVEMGALADLLETLNMYSSISFGDEWFYDRATMTIQVQTLIDMLSTSGFGMDMLYSMIDDNGNIVTDSALEQATDREVGGLLITTNMALGNDRDTVLYITLRGSSEQLLGVKKAVGAVKSYVNVSAVDGVFNLELTMPKTLYPYYMSAMLLLDQTQFDDLQGGMNVERTMNYYKTMIGDLTGDPNFSVETVENTLAELGKTVDLSAYANTFDTLCKLVNTILKQTEGENSQVTIDVKESTSKNYKAEMTCPASLLLSQLPEKMEMVTAMIADTEYRITYNITVTNRDTDYVAMIFDNSEAGLDKFYYSTADEFASKLAHLGNNSVVVLIADAELNENVTIANNVFINLNGFELSGNGTLNSSARVTISDSTLHTTGDDVGKVYNNLSGNFIITGGWYNQDVTKMLRKGYEQVNGYVSNIFYSIEETVVDEDTTNISINIPAHILSTRTIPEIKALAVEIAMDVAFNVYNAAFLSVNGEEIYHFDVTNLVSLATMSGGEIVDTLIERVELGNVKALALDLYDQMTSFGDIADAINDDGVIASYALETNGWAFEFGVNEENTILVNLVRGKYKDHTLNIAVVDETNDQVDDLANLAKLFAELENVLEVPRPVINTFKPSYNGGLKVDFDAEMGITVDLSHDHNYAALLVAAVAAANNDEALKSTLKTTLTNYLAKQTKDNTAALNSVLENITLAQFIEGLKHIKEYGCAQTLTSIGVTGTSAAKLNELEAIYTDLVYIAGELLTRLDITGGAQKLVNIKVAGSDSTYYFDKTMVLNRGGINAEMTLALTLTLMDLTKYEEDGGENPPVGPVIPVTPSTPSKPVVKDPKLNADASSDKLLGTSVATVGSDKYLQLDLHVDGITVEELLESLHISATGSRVEIEAAVTNSKTVDGKEIVVTGSVLTITAKNSRGTTTKEYVIVIDGDVNCDGYVNTADAVYLAWHYCDIASIEGTAAMIAATGNSKDTDVHADDAMRIVFKYLHWKAGDDRYVSKFGS